MAIVTKYPTIVVNDSSLVAGEVNWSSLNNIKAADDTDAQCTVQGGGTLTGSTSDDPSSASTSGSGADWFDPGAAADGSEYYYADVYAGGGEWSRYLQLRGMSFSIPVTAANGGANEVYKVKVEAIVSGQGSGKTMEVRLVTTGGSVCSPIQKTMPSSKSTLTFEYTNSQWGLPAARSNSTGLGVNIRCRTNGTNAGVYFVRVTVYYKSGTTTSNPNGIYATDFDFDLKDNAKINSVRVEWEEYLRNNSGGTSNTPRIPGKEIILLKANDGDHVAKESVIGVPTNRTVRTLTFTTADMPDVRRSNIEDPNFGVYLNLDANTSVNPGKVYLDFLRLVVDYTDPTYALAATLTSGKIIGEQVTYVLTLQNTNNCHQGVNIPVSISIPAGLSVASQSGDGTYNTGTGKWNAVLNSQKKATLTLVLNTSASGSKTITASVDGFSTTLNKSTTILAPTYTLTSPQVREIVTETYNVTYTITVGVNTSAVSTVNVNIPIPAGIQYVSSSGNGSYNSGTGVWTAQFVNKKATLTFTVKGITAGVVSQAITVGGASFTKTIEVLPANLTVPYHTEKDLPDEILAYLQDGEIYTISCWSIVTDTALGYVYPGEKNFTIAVVNGEQEYISDKATALNTVTRISTSFFYNKDAPIKLRIYGQWLEINPQNASHEVGGFALYHEEQLIANPNLLEGTTNRENVSTGSDITEYITGAEAFNGAAVESSTEWAGDGERSWHITMPGSATNEAVYFLPILVDKLPVLAGENRTTILKIKGSGTFKIQIIGRNSAGTTTADSMTVNVTATATPKYILVDYLSTKPETAVYDIEIWQISTPNPIDIYIDQIKAHALNPLENIAHRTDYELPAVLFTNPDNLLGDGDYAEATIIPNRTGGVLFPELLFGGLEEDSEVIIKGIEISGDCEVSNDISIMATLKQGTESVSQSIPVTASSTDFKIGGERDKWGLNKISLSDLTFILSPIAVSVFNVIVRLRNIAITIHYMFDETGGNPGFTVDGVHSREYSIFTSPEEDRPEGLNIDLQTSKLAMSDGDKVGVMTVTGKEISLKFQLIGDTDSEILGKIKEATTWLTPTRDGGKKPVTKELCFDGDDRIYDVILADSIKVDKSKGAVWYCTAKFLLPSGTARLPKDPTGSTGRNNGITPIKPVLTVLCNGSSEILITESYTAQYMKIEHQFIAGTVLTIDIQNRTILDQDGTDWMSSVSFDSYLITILEKSNYDFSGSTGVTIQKVEFEEAY